MSNGARGGMVDDPICGALGCTADAEFVIDHPNGPRVVCDDCTGDHPVIRRA